MYMFVLDYTDKNNLLLYIVCLVCGEQVFVGW